MVEYRYDELAFDRDEVAELLVMRGLPATDDLVGHLLATAEGWAAGLYLVATALKRRERRAGRRTRRPPGATSPTTSRARCSPSSLRSSWSS